MKDFNIFGDSIKSITVLQTVRDESEISTQCYTAPGGVLDYPYALQQKRGYRLQAEKAAEQIEKERKGSKKLKTFSVY